MIFSSTKKNVASNILYEFRAKRLFKALMFNP